MEKELVRHLMDNSQWIHKEDVVRKDSELCRVIIWFIFMARFYFSFLLIAFQRQHVVNSLKAKVAEL